MLMNALLTAGSVVFPIITLPYVTRILGPEGVGKVYFATSVVTFFSMFAELGIPVYGIRACARVRDDITELSRTAQEIIGINLITCAAAYGVYAIMLATVPRMAEDRFLMAMMSAVMVLNTLGCEWLYKALEKYTYITVRSLSFKLLALVGMFLMVRSSSDYVMYGFLTMFAASASNILNMCNLRKHILLKPVGGYDLMRHLPAMLMFFALAVATSVYTNLDLAILDLFKGDAEAGLYGVSVKIKLVIVSLVTSVSAVLLPRNSYYIENGRRGESMDLLEKTMTMITAASVPTVVYFILFAEDCIELLAGGGFSGAVISMKIIMPSVILIGMSNIIGLQLLVPDGREKDVVIAAVIGAAADLVLNLVLIPRFASVGAAAATLAAEACVTLYMIHAAGRDARRLFRGIPVLRLTIAAAAAAAAALPAGRLINSTQSPTDSTQQLIDSTQSLASFQSMGQTFLRLVLTAVVFFGIYIAVILLMRRINELLHRN